MKLTELSPNQAVLDEFASRLQQIRKQQGFSQDELAQRAGIGVATLRRMENGQDAQLGSWLKIIRALGMMDALDGLLPENYRSPRAEALAKKKRTRTAHTSHSGIHWGDQKQ